MSDLAGRHRLSRLLNPSSVALVGASTVPNVAGNDMVLELEVSRYPGRVYPVNPKYDEIEGRVDELLRRLGVRREAD